MPINNSVNQLINGFVIILGAALLLYSVLDDGISVYFKICGVILIMFGAYRASNHWVRHKDDHLYDEEE